VFQLAVQPKCRIFLTEGHHAMKRTRQEVAETIEAFVNGTGRQWDWDGFISIRLDDPDLEAIRQKCIAVRDEYPPSKPTDYCSEAGMEIMRGLAQSLGASSKQTSVA